MDKLLSDAATQVPNLAVLTVIVWMFLKEQRNSVNVIKDNTDALNSLRGAILELKTTKRSSSKK